jgi:hypothetical protein
VTSWAALLVLGAGHGINPAMGWLFAVALGLQRGSRRAVWSALGPLAAGHAMAIALAIGIAMLIGFAVPLPVLKLVIGALLVGLGLFRLVRSLHLVYGGMRVNSRELAVWSFLMATAHGAGLMVLPLVVGHLGPPVPPAHAHHMVAALVASDGINWIGMSAALVHTAGYLLITGFIAVIVYERLGVRFLRSAWINLDLIWSVALLVTGLATLLM